MAKFTVKRTVDAVVLYEAEVEAASAEEAAKKAEAHEDEYQWGIGDPIEHDARSFMTLDERGYAIESTKVGDL